LPPGGSGTTAASAGKGAAWIASPSKETKAYENENAFICFLLFLGI
jgi:hypothetical protein